MASPGWRYFATRLNGDGTEDLIHPDLPLENVQIETVLSGDSMISGTISPTYASLLGPDGEPILTEWGTAIYAEASGTIRGGGILTNTKISGSVLDIECPGFTNYGRDMPYTGSGYKGIEVDPIDVVRTIWDHIQSHPGGNIGLILDTTDTGGKVSIGTELRQVEFDTESGPVSFESGPYKLNWYSNHDLQGDVDDLASDTPFDYVEEHSMLPDGTMLHFCRIGYPSLGSRRNDVRFKVGVNVHIPLDIERNGEEYASGTMVLGAGNGAAMVRSLREPRPIPAGRLRRIAVVTDDRIKSKKKADARADAENQWRSRINDIDTIRVVDHSWAPLGSVQVGDQIRIEGREEWTDTSTWVRILSINISPEVGNVAEYRVARVDRLVS